MSKDKIISVILIILVGFAVDYKIKQQEDPYYRCMHAGENVGFIRSEICDLLANNSYDIRRYVSQEDFIVMDNGFYVKGNFFYGHYSNTNSMLPLIDVGSTGIYVYLNESIEVKLGDIIAFKVDGTKIAHRIINIDQDNEGVFYITKGDNNIYPDDFKVRRENVQGILVGVIW